MANKERILKEKLSYTGMFDFEGFYGFAHRWLDEEEELEVEERKYSEKVAGDSKNINFEWGASKTISDYFKQELKIEFKITNMTNIEVHIDGQKKKMNKGSVGVEITGNLIKDPKSDWETSPFNRFLRDVYNKYVIPGRISNMENKVRKTVVDLKENLKAFLEISGKR